MSDDREDRLGRLEAAIAALTTKIAVVTRPLRLAGGRHSTLYCSFCGKSQHEVDKLVAGPSIFICNECTDLCYGIVVLAGLRRGRICSGHGRVRLGLVRVRPPLRRASIRSKRSWRRSGRRSRHTSARCRCGRCL